MDYKEHIFQHQTVELDGNNFSACNFDDCEFIYSGGTLRMDSENLIATNCKIRFKDHAARTVQILWVLHHSGFSDAVERVFQSVRSDTMPS